VEAVLDRPAAGVVLSGAGLAIELPGGARTQVQSPMKAFIDMNSGCVAAVDKFRGCPKRLVLSRPDLWDLGASPSVSP